MTFDSKFARHWSARAPRVSGDALTRQSNAGFGRRDLAASLPSRTSRSGHPRHPSRRVTQGGCRTHPDRPCNGRTAGRSGARSRIRTGVLPDDRAARRTHRAPAIVTRWPARAARRAWGHSCRRRALTSVNPEGCQDRACYPAAGRGGAGAAGGAAIPDSGSSDNADISFQSAQSMAQS